MATTPPPAPGPTRSVGVRRFRADSAELMRGLRAEYGEVTRFRVGPYLMHQVAAPALVQRVLQDNTGAYRRGHVYRGFELFFGKGLLTTEGERWRALRATSQPYYRATTLNAKVPLIADRVADLVRRWAGPAARAEPVDVVPELMRLALDVVTRVVCGATLGHRGDGLLPTVPAALDAIFPGSAAQLLPRWVPGPHRRRVHAAQGALDAAVAELVAAHADGRTPPDGLTGALLATTDPVSGHPLTPRGVRDELVTHIMAGHETTGCGLAWTLYEIARHPEVHGRVVAELDDVLGGHAPEAVDLPRLTYLRQAVDESLRLHPPIPMFPREPVHDVELGGHRVPAGSTVFLSPYTSHHDPAHWPAPDTFDPDRFAPDRPRPARYTYLPFGGGPRRCVGAGLAEIEIRVAMAMILQRYRVRPVPGRPVVPHSMISLRPRSGLVLEIAERSTGEVAR